MGHPARRIRTLHLRAPSETLVRRGAILLEDALHTASLPEAVGRLLVIRSLNAGTIRGHQSPATLALQLEQEFRRLSATAVHAESTGAEAHPAVYFHDQLEACVSLARRLARQESTAAWFWPLAVKSWRREMSRDDALRALLIGALQTESGAVGAAVMLDELSATGAVDPLLAALRWQDGTALLRMSGWQAPPTPTAFAEPLSMPGGQNLLIRFLPVLGKWARVWGLDDPRSFWLSATVLLAETPGRAHDPRLPMRAQRLIQRAILPPAMLPDLVQPVSQETGDHSAASAEAAKTAPRSPDRADSTGAEAFSPEFISPALQMERSIPEVGSASMSSEHSAINAVPGEASASAISDGAFMPPVTPPGDQEPVGRAKAHSAFAKEEKALWPATASRTQLPAPTSYGGLFFLLTVLDRLGMGDWLAANPEWIEQDLPRRLLLHALRMLRANGDDPIFDGLTIGDRQPPPREFVAPARWLRGIASGAGLLLRRMNGDEQSSRTKILCDETGVLVLAVWRGPAPHTVRELIRGYKLQRAGPARNETDLDLTLRAWLTALRRWCRRYLGVGVREIVCRPGRVVVTRTHVDVLFDLNQADARLRRGGLDLNPAWVPWLGRVVTFHYLAGEQRNDY